MALTALTILRKQIRLSRNLKSLVMATCLSAWLKPNIPSPMTRHFSGRPSGFKITIRNCRIAAGAGFIVVLTGDVMTMPGLPKVPAAEKIDVTDDGVISGLF